MGLEEASSRQRASGEGFLPEVKGTLLTSHGAVSMLGPGEEEAFGCRSVALVGDQRGCGLGVVAHAQEGPGLRI